MKNFPYICAKTEANPVDKFCPTYYIAKRNDRSETNIKSIVVEEGIKDIGNCVFYKCTKVTSITLPAGITRIGQNAFWGCGGLKTLVIPDGVTKIEKNAFNGCKDMTDLTIPDSVNTLGIDILVKAFLNRTKTLTIHTNNQLVIDYINTNYAGENYQIVSE